MIVWGGANGMDEVNTGGRYSPSTDRWLSTATSGAPAPRHGHIGVWSGSEMVVWGGFSATYGHYQEGGRYDPASGTWQATPVPGMPSARANPAGVWTGTELVAWGGFDLGGMVNSGGRCQPQ